MTTPPSNTNGEDELRTIFHRMRTRALRDAPIYLQHINEAENAIRELYLLRSDVIEAVDTAYRYEITDLELLEHQNGFVPEIVGVIDLKKRLGLPQQFKEEKI